MRITMIGDRGCGKTTFMAGLYREMSKLGLQIQLSNRDQRAHVDSIVAKLKLGQYPAATDFAQSYRFDFTVDNVKLLDFTWYDYRGDALIGDVNSRETQLLFQDIDTSDGLLVFIDNTTLDDPKWDSQSKYWRTIVRAVRQHASHADEDHPRSLGFVHTKMDKNVQYQSPYPVETNVIDLIKTLPNMRNLYGILALSAVTKDESINTVSVFFRLMTPFILMALQEQAYKIKHINEMSDLFDIVADNYNEAGWLDDFFCGLSGDPSSRDKVVSCINMLKSYPLYDSYSRGKLIDSFLEHWNNRSFWNDCMTGLFGGQSESDIAFNEFKEIVDIWVAYDNDIRTLYGSWSEDIMKYLEDNSGKDDSGFYLF